MFRREENTPENATHPKMQIIGGSENLRFRVHCVLGCFCFPLKGRQNTPENATHPKSHFLGTMDYLRIRVCRVFGCVLALANVCVCVCGGGAGMHLQFQEYIVLFLSDTSSLKHLEG